MKIKKIFLLLPCVFLLSGCVSKAPTIREPKETKGQAQAQFNKGNCLADECLMIENLEYPIGNIDDAAEEALVEAIQDEYKAWSTYFYKM